MDPTGRFWRASAVALFLAALALIAAQPLFLFGTAAIGTVLLVRQWAFHTATTVVADTVDIDVDLPRTHVQDGETIQTTLMVTLTESAPVKTRVKLTSPLATRGSEQLSVEIPPGERTGTATAQLQFTTVGTTPIPQPTLSMVSTDGLFTQTIQHGPEQSLVVEPRVPNNLHVGEGGDRINVGFGAHQTGELGQGLDPVEPRKYTPGDDMSNIDWKTTARQGEAFVREFKVESDRRTVLLFDHRESTATGKPGEQVCTYLREVAVGLTTSAEEFGDPVGLYTVGDGGLTNEFIPSTEQYQSIRSVLHEITPTVPDERTVSESTQDYQPRQQTTATSAQAKATALDGGSTFDTKLYPYFSDLKQYVRRIEGKPLLDVARTYLGQIEENSQTIIFTSDHDPTQVRETVKIARGNVGHVVVFLAPQVLFEQDGMRDIEATYDQYTEFEQFRKELARMDRVSAYEVTPSDRLEAMLAAGQQRGRSTTPP